MPSGAKLADPKRRVKVVTEFDSAGLEVLSRSQCVRALGSTDRGRLGLNVGALPTILPVRYAIEGDEVLVCVQVGSVADKATNGNVVAFQADGVEPNGQTGA
jgi:hypothetical protein